MKKNTYISSFLLLLIALYGGSITSVKQSEPVITLNVTANHPLKELILQDFMVVEYVALETTDEFVCQGIVLDVGKEIMLVINIIQDGNIYIFDRKGKGLGIINRKGQGKEEYLSLFRRVVNLDEENNEIFVSDDRGINVYDYHGNFLRRFPRGAGSNFVSIRNFDRYHFFCRETSVRVTDKSTESQPFAIISKKDGSIVKDFHLRIRRGIDNRIRTNEGFTLLIASSEMSIIPSFSGWLLSDISSDTIYRLLPDFRLTPFMTRTPSVYAMNPEVFLIPALLTDRYFFLDIVKKEFDRNVNGGIPSTALLYDRQEQKTFRYCLFNGDYTTKKTVDEFFAKSNEIAFWQKIEAFELVEANKKGELKGKLKEIAATLDEESNPVIMLVKYKK